VLQEEDLSSMLPLQSLHSLRELCIEDGNLPGDCLPEFWTRLTALSRLMLPRCSFVPMQLSRMPALRELQMTAWVGDGGNPWLVPEPSGAYWRA